MKRNKRFKALLSLGMAAVLSMGSLTTVFAAPGPTSGANADNVKIKKVLEMNDGTDIPSTGFNFEFEFTAATYNGAAASATVVNGEAMPTVGPISMGFNDGVDTPVTPAPKAGVKTYEKETGKIFDGVTWKAPGSYTYIVKETADTYTEDTGETMTYSEDKYEVTASVINGSTAGSYVIDSIGVKKLDENGDPGPKIEITPGAGNEFKFTNVFEVKSGGDGTDPVTDNGSLLVKKTVAGDKADQNKYFAFTIDTTKAGTQTSAKYRAYLIENSSVITPTAANGTFTIKTDDNGFSYIEVTAGSPLSINLKHGQELKFFDMLVGASFKADESANLNYKAKIDLTVNGASSTITKNTNELASTGSNNIGKSTNAAAFTNTFDENSITETGLTVNDLPFIAMIVLAIGALGAFVVIQSRKKNYSGN